MIENGAVIKQKKDAGGIPITRIETLSNDVFNRDRLGYADIFDEAKYSHYILDDLDLVMSHINSRAFLGRTVIYRRQGDEKIIHGMNVLRLKTDLKVLNPLYAYYYFKTKGFRTAIDHIRKDAINQSSLATSDIKIIEILIPSIEDQSVIISILDNLDRKIALNRAINQNLEALAKQLYDYWFVQFDFPDEQGKPYKSSGGKMVWNDALKRHVPSIWSFRNLEDVASFVKDKVETSKLTLNTYISTENMQPNRGGISIASNLPNTNYVTACNCGDVVIANIRPYFKKIFLIPTNGFGCSSAVLCIRANDSMYSRFVYGTLSDDVFFDYVMSGAKGSKMPRGDKEQIMQYPVILPNKDLVEAFNCFVSPIHSQIHLYRKQAESLTKQRDELLPLLMNGQVSLNSDLSNILDCFYISFGIYDNYPKWNLSIIRNMRSLILSIFLEYFIDI